MKRNLIVVTLLSFIFVFISACSQDKASNKIKLTYSNFFPPSHIQSVLAESWCKEVEKRTGGEVVVEYFPGGTLTKAKNCYNGVVDGISDVGMSVLAYSRGRFPVLSAVDLPLGYKSGKTATKVANMVYKEFTPKEFDDTHVMFFHAHGPGLIHTKDKPVTKMADLKGMKLRATGNSAKVVKALGGTPVGMPMPDSYQSIQKGIVQGGVYPIETNKGWKMGEVVDYCTIAYDIAYTTTFFVTMNKDKWKMLSEKNQKIIEKINQEWIVKHGEAWDDSDKKGKEFFLSKGNKIIELDKGELPKWKKAVKPILNVYIDDMKKKNIEGDKVLAYTMSVLEKLQ
jgi:TRAP-type C4-dicarboxylate transport system substrate-binding protein